MKKTDYIEVTSKSGFTCKLPTDVKDDWNILKDIRLIENGDESAIIDLAQDFLGDEAKNLEAYMKKKSKTGRIKATAMIEEVFSMITGMKELKNSSTSSES